MTSIASSRGSTAPCTPDMTADQVAAKKVSKPRATTKVNAVGTVDVFVPSRGDYEVLTDTLVSRLACTAMLNQTNLSENNNKFYLIQALQRSRSGEAFIWFRWGRVGYSGQTNLVPCESADDAVEKFRCKFFDKTLNEWTASVFKSFKPQVRKYTLLPVETLTEAAEHADGKPAAVEVVKLEYEPTKLDLPVFELVKLISSKEMFESELLIAGLDLTKMPLGRISGAMISAGYKILRLIEAELENPGGSKAGPSRNVLAELSGRFYTVIPHSFGFANTAQFIINSFEMLRQKQEVLESLQGVKDAVDAKSAAVKEELCEEKVTRRANPVDSQYERLSRGLEVVDRNSDEFRLIEKYKTQTQGETHAFTTTIRNIFKLSQSDPSATTNTKRRRVAARSSSSTSTTCNTHLLWHGSRLTNWLSIMSSGLKIAPPEAPHTGFMFGKGIYTADCFSKAAQYCFVNESSSRSRGGTRTGLVVLCEVDLGNSLELMEADHDADKKLGTEFTSTKGVGQFFPDPKEAVLLETGVVVPCGKLIEKPKVNVDEDLSGKKAGRASRRLAAQNQQGLMYNEYIVYEPERVRMKYIVELEFGR